MKEEIWKPVNGYDGRYWISSFGRVWSNITKKILSAHINSNGYENVQLFKLHGGSQVVRVHRLVAEAFIQNPDNLPEVNHKDENSLNNHASNLEWCTHQYNVAYGTNRMRARGKLIGRCGGKKTAQYSMFGNLIATYPSSRYAGMQTKIADSAISACARGKRKQAGKFMWKFYSGDNPPAKIQMHQSKRYIPVCSYNRAYGATKTFLSISDAAKQIHCSETKLRTAIKEHKKCEGLYWKIIDFKEEA